MAEGALRGAGGRPNVLVRYANGIDGEFFYQKRAPASRPAVDRDGRRCSFPSGRTAEEVVPRDAAALAWMANLGCLELHPHPVRADDLDHPDELRVDLDPMPGVEWPQIRDVARVVREVLADFGLVGWPKTSGSRGIHVNVRIHRRWSFDAGAAGGARARARGRAARARRSRPASGGRRSGTASSSTTTRTRRTARSRAPTRCGRSRTRASRRRSRGTSSSQCRPEEFTLRTMPARFADHRRPARGHRRAAPCSLDALLELSARQEAEGLGDAPWPPHYAKQEGEPPRVAPSRKKSDAKPAGRRVPKKPLLEIARAARKEDALAGLERWKARHPDAAAHLEAADVLVDSMRGRSSTWTRVRVNLEHVPEALRPAQEPPDPDYDPWRGVSWPRARDRGEARGR